jgi:hypothetical protein
MESITSFLSPESTEGGKAAAIDAAFSSLRAAGANAAVEEFYPKIVAAIENKNFDEFDALSERVLDFATKNMDVPAAAREGEAQMAASIEQLLSTADSRNVPLPPALVANAATAFAKGDDKTLLSLSKSIETMLADNIQAQITEEKIPTRLDDGSVVLIGKTTRTRYDPTLAPIPSGNKNSQLFASVASDAYSPKSKEIMATMGGGDDLIGASAIGAPMQKQPDIGASPEAYASMERPALSSIEQKEEARKRVRDLYLSGDKDGALDLLNSAGGKGIFGGDYTIDELDVMYGNEASPENKKPLKEKTERDPISNFIPLSDPTATKK